MNHQIMSFIIPIAVLGLLIGSFLNVVIYRTPIMSKRRKLETETDEIKAIFAKDNQSSEYDLSKPFNLNMPHSACPRCGHVITAWENIPVISWLILRGKCSGCHLPISKRYPFVELLTCALFAVAALISHSWFMLVSVCSLMCLLVSTIGIIYDNENVPKSLKYLLISILIITVMSIYI
ncbi:prepilin peptidase [Photobacterium leiognathi]|uniref:prepilin peptidase n=1 Tax=Photobacterium leiognathi TaxID=553611 RepID=UPI002982A260|nr:prepilin peptidase [Photobacterium leiognathi]